MDVPIRKLRYESKTAALLDLIIKSVIGIDYKHINGTQAVVECGIITLVQATETTAAVIAVGYHYDVMTTDDIFFESEIFPKNAKYKFAGEL